MLGIPWETYWKLTAIEVSAMRTAANDIARERKRKSR